MNDAQPKYDQLVDTTDSLEAIGVFKWWKNFLFIILLVCMLLTQVSFWVVQTKAVRGQHEIVIPLDSEKVPAEKTEIKIAAEEVTKDANDANAAAANEINKKKLSSYFRINLKYVFWLIRVCNFVLIITAALYCLSILFSLKISLLGRLGGINHISRAFFLSLVFAVIMMPWQKLFGNLVAGVLFTGSELFDACETKNPEAIFSIIFFYLRFCFYWLVALAILIFAQLRTTRWAKATLRRLELA